MLRRKLHDGWLSVTVAPERFDLAHVLRRPGKKPEVLLLHSQPRADEALAGDLVALRKSLGLARYRCTNLLYEGEYQLLQVEPPEVPAAEVREALRWRIKDSLNFPAEVATVDMLEIPSDPGIFGRAKQIFAVAASNELLAPRVALFDAARVPLLAIDIPELAQRNISALYEQENRGLALLAFDAAGALMTFTFHGELIAVRRIDVSSPQLQQAAAARREQLFERIALEVQRSLDNFDRQHGQISVPHLLVSPLPETPEFFDYLRKDLAMPVEELDLAEVLDFPSLPELTLPARQSQCLKALGAALRD